MEPLIALALWSAITTAALVLSSSSCPVGAIVSEELDEELSKCFYKVVCSSKSAQGVGGDQGAGVALGRPRSPGRLDHVPKTRYGCELFIGGAPLA